VPRPKTDHDKSPCKIERLLRITFANREEKKGKEKRGRGGRSKMSEIKMDLGEELSEGTVSKKEEIKHSRPRKRRVKRAMSSRLIATGSLFGGPKKSRPKRDPGGVGPKIPNLHENSTI